MQVPEWLVLNKNFNYFFNNEEDDNPITVRVMILKISFTYIIL